MNWLQIVRLAAFSATLVFAVIVLGVSAHFTNIVLNGILFVDGVLVWPKSSPETFSTYNLAVAALTLLVLPAMMIVDVLRRGAITSMIAVELGVSGVLWVLWLAAGANTADKTSLLYKGCSYFPNVSILSQACGDNKAAEAFSFLAWLALMGYMSILLIVCIMSQVNGNRIWTSTVREAQPVLSSSTKAKDPQSAAFSGATMATPMLQQVPHVMTPQSQYPYPPVPSSVSPLASSYGLGNTTSATPSTLPPGQV